MLAELGNINLSKYRRWVVKRARNSLSGGEMSEKTPEAESKRMAYFQQELATEKHNMT